MNRWRECKATPGESQSPPLVPAHRHQGVVPTEEDETMARPWEAEFIRLWQAGVPRAAITQALGIPVGTVKSKSTDGGRGGPA
jgi:hypothetical protein